MKSVFLSHCWADKAFTRRLASDLELAGGKVWFDEAELKLGDSLIEKISKAIDETDYLTVVLSPDSVKSSWVNKELEIALNKEISGKRVHVLPLLYKDCEIPTFLNGKLYADFRKENNYVNALNQIKDRLGLPLTVEKSEVEKQDETNAILIHELSGYTHAFKSYLDRAHWRLIQRGEKELDKDLHALREIAERQSMLLDQQNVLRYFQKGQYPLYKEHGKLAKIIYKAVSILRPEAGYRNVRIEMEKESLDKAILYYDKRLIDVAIFNVVENAVKYSFKDTVIRIRCSFEQQYISLVIENVGLAIDEKDSKNIFEPGYRGREAIRTVVGGAGYGLYITSVILSSHGGSLSYDCNRIDNGQYLTRFFLRLPLEY